MYLKTSPDTAVYFRKYISEYTAVYTRVDLAIAHICRTIVYTAVLRYNLYTKFSYY
jgi:hypothetical protein